MVNQICCVAYLQQQFEQHLLLFNKKLQNLDASDISVIASIGNNLLSC
jgi:hypothetical protein